MLAYILRRRPLTAGHRPLIPGHRPLLSGRWPLFFFLLFLGFTPAFAQENYTLTKGTWVKKAPVDPKSAEGQLQSIRRTIAENQGDDAWDMADDWIEAHPNHPLLVEAYLIRGDAKVAAGNEFKALFDYEYLIRQYPGTDQFNIALEREFEIAKLYTGGLYRKFLGMRLFDATGEAEELYIRIQERAPGSDIGERASMALGDHYYTLGDMKAAADAYSMFLVNYPRSVSRERGMLRVIQSNLATFKGPRFDATGLLDAATRLKQFKHEFPASAERIGADALLVRIDESLALKTYLNGKWYWKRGEDVSAVTMFQRVIHDHPQTGAARLAMADLTTLKAPMVSDEVESKRREEDVVPLPAKVNIPAGSPATQPDGGKNAPARTNLLE